MIILTWNFSVYFIGSNKPDQIECLWSLNPGFCLPQLGFADPHLYQLKMTVPVDQPLTLIYRNYMKAMEQFARFVSLLQPVFVHPGDPGVCDGRNSSFHIYYLYVVVLSCFCLVCWKNKKRSQIQKPFSSLIVYTLWPWRTTHSHPVQSWRHGWTVDYTIGHSCKAVVRAVMEANESHVRDVCFTLTVSVGGFYICGGF